MIFKKDLEQNIWYVTLDLGEVSIGELLTLIFSLSGWDDMRVKKLVVELAKRAGIDAELYFETFVDRDYSDLCYSAIKNLNI